MQGALCAGDPWGDWGSRQCVVTGPSVVVGHAHLWSLRWLWRFAPAPVAMQEAPCCLRAHRTEKEVPMAALLPAPLTMVLCFSGRSRPPPALPQLWCTAPEPPRAICTQPTPVLSLELTSKAHVSVPSPCPHVSDCGVPGAVPITCFALLNLAAALFSDALRLLLHPSRSPTR